MDTMKVIRCGKDLTERWLRLIGFQYFPQQKQFTLECESSDHKPIPIYLAGIPRKVHKPWRFKQMQLDEDGGCETIKSFWQIVFPCRPMERVEGKIKKYQFRLQQWSSVVFGNVICSLKEKKDQLPKAKQMAIRGSSMAKVQRLKFEINGLLIKEEKMWKKRSRAQW